MTLEIRISVVLCTYNGEAYLGEQLSTLLTQSRLPDEVIIGDDASSDRTWEIVKAFATQARSRRIAVQAIQRPERLGYVSNFSRSLALATGELVFLCDQDDAWHPDKIALMMERFGDPRLTLLHTDARLVDAEGKDLGHGLFEALELSTIERERVDSGQAFAVYLRRNLATGATAAFRRELLTRALPVPPVWVHDAWLAVMAAATGGVGMIDDALIDYRQHGANQIGMRPRTLRRRIDEFRQSRNAELRSDLARLDVLTERLSVEGSNDDIIMEVTDMRDHVTRRIQIGEKGVMRRIVLIGREWTTGGYARFATGLRTAVRDLLRKG